MSDAAIDILVTVLEGLANQATLWVVDENIDAAAVRRISPAAGLRAITNRIDIQRLLRTRGLDSELSDFQCAECAPAALDAVVFRISKEKPLVHHVINRAADLLKPQGRLILIGAKNEGIKTYIKKAADFLGGPTQQKKGRQGQIQAAISRAEKLGVPLDDRDYRDQIRLTLELEGFPATECLSKPGIYGWSKSDQGSALLISQCEQHWRAGEWIPQRVIDLGCGYGYLSIMASRLLSCEFIATDNNIAAVDICTENFDRLGINGRVVLADAGDSITERADMVLCNPPFHQGFSVERDLTRTFLAAARRLLRPGGVALFVVNSFIPLQRLAEDTFETTDELVNTGRFKVVRLQTG